MKDKMKGNDTIDKKMMRDREVQLQMCWSENGLWCENIYQAHEHADDGE